MSRKPDPLESWVENAIEIMVRKDLTLRQAAQQLGIETTPQEADNISGKVRFQETLEAARLRYYAEVGSNPRLTVDALICPTAACRIANLYSPKNIKHGFGVMQSNGIMLFHEMSDGTRSF